MKTITKANWLMICCSLMWLSVFNPVIAAYSTENSVNEELTAGDPILNNRSGFTLTDGQSNNIVHNSEIIISADPSTEEMKAYVFVTNNTAEAKDLKVKKEEISLLSGTYNGFCWNSGCFPPFIYVSPDPITLNPGATTTSQDFYGTYSPENQEGISEIRYTFFDANNPNDSISVRVKYITAVESENIMILPDVTGNPGSNVTVGIEINNDDNFVAFQLDIPLPAGFSYVANSIALNAARKQNHVIQADILPGTNTLRVISFSLTSAPFLGNSGQVCSFALTTPATPGAYFLAIQNPFISDPISQNIITGSQGGYVKLGEVYTVTFDVKDQANNPISDAVITLGGITNPAGAYQFFALNGTHAYGVVKKYYTTATGNVTVAGSNQTVNVVLGLAPTYEVTFNVTQISNGQPVANASITLKAADNETFQGTTAANGSYTFTGILSGNYTYTVAATGLGTVNGSLQVIDQNVTQNVQLSNTFVLTLVDKPVGAAFLLQGAGNVAAGTVRNIRAIANPTHIFKSWTKDGDTISTASQFGYTMPAENVTLTANFIRKTHTINASPNNPFLGTVEGAGVYNYGDSVTLHAKRSSSACTFVSWTEGGLVRSTDSVWTSWVNSNKTYVANFTAPATYNVTFVVKDQNGQDINTAEVTLYSVTNPAGTYLFAGVPAGTFTYSVEAEDFEPANGTVDVIGQNVIVQVVLTGSNPVFQVTPAEKNFGTVNVNTQSQPQVFTVKNNGGGVLEITDVELRLNDVNQFVLNDANAYPVTLNAGETLQFSVAFAPTGTGIKNTLLTITDGLTKTLHDVPLSGTGFDPNYYLPFTEDFSGIASGEIPADWNRTDENWGVSLTSKAGGQAPEMHFNWDPENNGIIKLITPPIQLNAASIITLSFKHMVEDVANTPESYTLKVETSVDGGATWIKQWDITPGGNIPAEIVTINLNALAGQTCKVAWVFEGETSNINGWYVDDVLICHVPLHRVVQNETIGDIVCYDGTQTISVSNVTVLSGGEVDLISGKTITLNPAAAATTVDAGGKARITAAENIVFKPNVHVKAGACMRARIAVLPYCCQPTPIVAAKDSEIITDDVLPVPELSGSSFVVYPNPTNGRITMILPESANGIVIEIFSLVGERLAIFNVSGKSHHEFDLTAYPKGIYFVRVQDGSEFVMQKIVKQ